MPATCQAEAQLNPPHPAAAYAQNTALANIVTYPPTGPSLAEKPITLAPSHSNPAGTYVPTSPAGTAGNNRLVVANWQQAAQFQTFLTALHHGSASIVFLGDSTTQGENATPQNIALNGSDNSTQLSFPYELAQALNHGKPHLSGRTIIAATDNFLGADSASVISANRNLVDHRITIAGNTQFAATGASAGGYSAELPANGSTVTFTPAQPVTADRAALIYATAQGTIMRTIVAIPTGTYSRITLKNTTGASVFIQSMALLRPQSNTASQLEIYNAGVDGLTTAGAIAEIPAILSVKPDLVIIDLGINDLFHIPAADAPGGAVISHIVTNIGAIIAKLQAGGAEIVLMVPTPFDSPSYAAYMPALQRAYGTIARHFNIPLIDLSASYGDDFQALYASGLTSGDVVHPNATFYADIGAKTAGLLANAITQPAGTAQSIMFSSSSIQSGNGTRLSDGQMGNVGRNIMANHLSLSNGAAAIISPGGTTLSASLAGATALFISSGGLAASTTLQSGGGLYILPGGTATATSIASGAAEFAYGGTSIAPIVASGGSAVSFPGGAIKNAKILHGGSQILFPGGTAIGTSLAGGETVFGTDQGALITEDGLQAVAGGGLAAHATVSSGSTQTVAAGGVTRYTTVLNGGTEIISAGGLTISSVVSSGGTAIVLAGGEARATLVKPGGHLNIMHGGKTTSAAAATKKTPF